MRVMLVKPITPVRHDLKNAPRPEVGDIDMVIEEAVNGVGVHYYYLQRFGDEFAYMANLFAILPDPSADELVEETTIAEPLIA